MKKYTCTNCDDKTDNKYIRAMIKAGFAARHLDCRTCGQQGVVEAEDSLIGLSTQGGSASTMQDVVTTKEGQAPKTYEIDGIFKTSEIDIFDEGCQMEGGYECHIDHHIKADTMKELLERFAAFVDVEIKDIQENVCDEAGRIEGQRTEGAEGLALTSSEFAAWKAGNAKAWLCTYQAKVEKVTRGEITI